MMQQSHQREVYTLLLTLQSETMKIENKENTETVSNSALEKQVVTAQAVVAIQKIRIKILQTEYKQLIFDLWKSKRSACELEAQIATLKLEYTAALAKHPPQTAAGDPHPKRCGEFQGVGAALLEAADQVHDARHRAGDI